MLGVIIGSIALAGICLGLYAHIQGIRHDRRARNRKINHMITIPPSVRTWPDVH